MKLRPNSFSYHLLYFLYQAILASVVIANLIGLLKQFSRLRDLWKIYKTDAVSFGIKNI